MTTPALGDDTSGS